jgi:hypothetical protein
MSNGLVPTLNVSIDFTNAPTNATRVWTDVTTDVRSLNYTLSGRNDVLATTSTGSLSMTLSNKSGNYDPSNTNGAYTVAHGYLGVRQFLYIQVQGQWSGTAYNRWTGCIESWDVSWPSAGKDNIVSVTASDVLQILNNFDLGGNDLPEESTGARVATVCALIPALPCTNTPGRSYCVDSGTLTPGMSAMSHLQQVESTENGRLFADGGGTINFQDRYWRVFNSTTVQGTIGDAAGEIRYTPTADLASNTSNLWNHAVINPTPSPGESGLGTAIADNTASQTAYFPRTIQKTYLTDNLYDCIDAAQWLVQIYGTPKPKLPAIQLLPSQNTSLWPAVLGLNNSDLVTFKRRPSYGGTISSNMYIEQVAETIIPGTDWQTTVQMLPVLDYPGVSLWILGTAALGSTTALAY